MFVLLWLIPEIEVSKSNINVRYLSIVPSRERVVGQESARNSGAEFKEDENTAKAAKEDVKVS